LFVFFLVPWLLVLLSCRTRLRPALFYSPLQKEGEGKNKNKKKETIGAAVLVLRACITLAAVLL